MSEAVKQRVIPIPAEEHMHRESLVKLLSFILIFSVMNVTMFNVAIPDISKQFFLLPSEVSWVSTGYTIIYAIGSLTYGKLADIYPLRKLMTIGLILFAVGSFTGFLAQNYGMLLAGRFIQSAGAASIPALAMIIPTRFFPAEQRGRVLGVIASTLAFASGIGPIVGGFITGTLHWRFLFLLSLATLFTIPFLRKWLESGEKSGSKMDMIGAVLMAGAISTLLLAITLYSIWLFGLFAVLFILFSFHVTRVGNPFIPPQLMKNSAYRNGLLTAFLGSGCAFTLMLITPMMLKGVNDVHTSVIGLVLFPGAMSAAVMGRIGGKLSDKKGSVFVMVTALSLLIIGFLLLSTLAGYSAWVIALTLLLVNSGYAFVQSSLANIVSGTLPREQMGVGMGLFQLTNFMSGALGGAISAKLLDHSTAGVPFNPFSAVPEAAGYSNLYLGLFVICAVNLTWFYLRFREHN